MVVLGSLQTVGTPNRIAFTLPWVQKRRVSVQFLHTLRSPSLVLISQLHVKVSLVRLLHKFSHIETMLLSHVLTTNVAEYIRIIDTDTTLWSHNS